MNRIYILLAICVLMLIPSQVKADTCTYKNKADLRNIASNVSYSYDYTENNDNVIFSITFTNLTSELYIIDTGSGTRYDYNGTNELTINNVKPGSKLEYRIYPTDAECMNTYLATKYINLPGYNKYYKDPLCKGLEQYSICYKWQSNNLTYDQFVKQANDYRNTQNNNKKENNNNSTEETVIDKLFKFIILNYIYIIIGILIAILIISYIVNKKKDDLDL